MNVIHIFGTPRSGSTLMQKILNTSRHTSTLPETWFLLHANSYRLDSGFNELGFNATRKGVAAFFNNIQVLDEFQIFYEFYRGLLKRKFDTDYFIEKTPRNIAFIHDIMRCLSPKDKVIIVRRDPKETFESYLDYFDSFPYLKSYKYFEEINRYNNIIEDAIAAYGNRVLVVDFHMMISKDGVFLTEIRDHLGLDDISLENLSNIGSIDDYGDKKMSGFSDVVSNRKKKRKYVYLLSNYLFESKFSIFSFLICPLSYIIFRFNVNLWAHIFKNNKFIH
jgi:hypothetical protein